jgi:AsmA-like C-terminal region
MPSPSLNAASQDPLPIQRVPPSHSRQLIVVIMGGLTVIVVAGVLYHRLWPFTSKSVIEDLAEASDSAVTVRSFHGTYFPVPGCVLDGVQFRHGGGKSILMSVDRFIIKGSFLGILRRHVPRIIAVGTLIVIPPFGSKVSFNTRHSRIVVDHLQANGSIVEFTSRDPRKRPFRFDVHEALLSDVRWGAPIRYELKLHNPEPPGELSVGGKFGSWTTGHPEQTPISGTYSFDHADLGVYGGIAGELTSKGKFEGSLQHINISGTTDIPDFEVKSGGHKVRLQARFDAFVDATQGDTFLQRVEAHLGQTTVLAQGSIANSKGGKGKWTQLRLSTRRGRIEDILGLSVEAAHSPVSGEAWLQARAEIPPGDQPFLEKLGLHGEFGIDEGSFSEPKTQRNVDELSAGARGENKQDPETVLTGLQGRVDLRGGVAQFRNLSFGMPGVKARMLGAYNIINHKINLHGRMRVDSKISKTSSGFKAAILKVIDPFFKKKKQGEIVPVHIEGTYEHPQFGLDVVNKQDPHPAAK